MKKTIALVVTVTLIMSLAITAFAAQPETDSVESESCNHVWGPATEYETWEYGSDTQCRLKIVHTKTCTKCGEVNQTVETTYRPHAETLVNATCDGTTQTHTYRCTICNGHPPAKYVTCPGAGKSHKSGCMWLPI